MAKYGVMLRYPNGSPFYIDGTRPIAFLRKRTVNINNPSSGGQYGIDLDSNSGLPYMYFVYMDTDTSWAKMTSAQGRYQITCGSNTSGRSFNITIYTFGFEPPTLPKWGIAIWDEAKNLIITNETKVLKGLDRAGTNGSQSAGINTNVTLSGKRAIIPAECGFLSGIINVTPPQPWGIGASFGCYYNGSTTRVYGAPEGQLAGTVTTTASTLEAPLYIDCSLYD